MYYIFESKSNSNYLLIKKEPHESVKYYPCDSSNYKISCSRYFGNLKEVKNNQKGLIEKDEYFLVLMDYSPDFTLIYQGEDLEDLEIKIPEHFL